MAPTNIGSAGSSSGGGAIHLTVSGVISNNGLIRSDGGPGAHYSGSGGGIYLVAWWRGACPAMALFRRMAAIAVSPTGVAGAELRL